MHERNHGKAGEKWQQEQSLLKKERQESLDM